MRIHLPFLHALVAPLIWSAEVRAEDEETPHELPGVEVVARGASSSDAFAQTRAVQEVSSNDIRENDAKALPDALRSVPGTAIQQTTPGQGTVYVRGLSGRAVGHSVDGVRLNTAFYRAGNNPYLATVDTLGLSRVTVIPGALSVEYGSDALGGVVLMSTPTPGYSQHGGDVMLDTYFSASSNPLGAASHVGLSRRTPLFSTYFGLSLVRSGDVVPGRGKSTPVPSSYVGLEREVGDDYAPQMSRAQEGTNYDFIGANLTLQRRWDEIEVVVRAQGGLRPELRRYDQMTPLFSSEPPSRAYAATSPMTRTMVSAELNHRPKRGFYDTAQLLLAWQALSETNLSRSLVERCLDVSNDAQECSSRYRLEPSATQSKELNRSNAWTARAGAVSRLGKSWRLYSGAEGHWDAITSRSDELSYESGTTSSGDSRYPDGSLFTEGGLFTKIEVQHGPLSAFFGVRGMAFAIDIPARENLKGDEGLSLGLFDYAASAGFRVALSPSAALVATVGRGVRMPNIGDFSALGTRAKGRYQIPNEDISPEHSYTSEFGVKLKRGRARMETYVFATRYADAIVLMPTAVNGQEFTEEGDRYYQSDNAAHLDYFGIDSHGEAPLFGSFSVFGRVLAMLGTQFNPTGTEPATTPADRVPPYQGELGLRGGPFGSSSFRVFGRFRHQQARLNDPVNVEDNRIPEGGTPGYATLHARGSYWISDTTEAALLADNITNAVVLDHGSGFYGPGFSLTASLHSVY